MDKKELLKNESPLQRENQELRDENQTLRKIAYENFSEDGSSANQEFISILRSSGFKIRMETSAKEEKHAYYSIRLREKGKGSRAIFYIENHTENTRSMPGLLTTPCPYVRTNSLKEKYEEYTRDWDHFGSRGKRKQYDIRGKRISDVMDILNKFKM